VYTCFPFCLSAQFGQKREQEQIHSLTVSLQKKEMTSSPPNTGLLSNKTLLKHLPEGSDIALHLIYQEIRPGVLRALERAGASKPEAVAYFQAGLLEAASLARTGKYPVELPLFAGLEQLSLAHYQSQQHPAGWVANDYWIPDAISLETTRHNLYTWRALASLGKSCEQTLLSKQPSSQDAFSSEDRWTARPSASMEAEQSRESPGGQESCEAALLKALKRSNPALPSWAKDALERTQDYQIWKKSRSLDQRLELGMPISSPLAPNPTNRRLSKWILYALAAGLLLSGGYWWYQTARIKALFDDHFQPPQQLLADINRRFEKDTTGLLRPAACQELLQTADQHYSAGRYEAAEQPLRQLIQEDELEDCYSDGCFALAIVLLQQDKSEEALEFLSKIENIEAYGEDLYWYQALAMVQLARHQPSLKTVAKGALERFLENTQNEARRQEGTKLLEEL
jgi:tetratricopeptide (TPR) repeat protein